MRTLLLQQTFSTTTTGRPKRFQIAIDGVAATGKTQTARELSRRLPGFIHIDSGAMYRAITLKAIENNIDPTDAPALHALALHTRLAIEPASHPGQTLLRLDGRDVGLAIRSQDVTRTVATVAAHREVREVVTLLQRRLAYGDAEDGSAPGTSGKLWEAGEDAVVGVVMEGRDIGSAVLPEAHLKIYLDGSQRVRAWRRLREMVRTGLAVAEEGEKKEQAVRELEREMAERDRKDMEREVSPLRKAEEAVVVDTSYLSMDEQVAMIEALARVRLAACNES
ncbi:hypothetical protein HDU96_007735 [Phlyctochytrium bullatum]|nr:hypothetical protein HDU96_007735 [Phlyctochytrium bullatum]